MGYIHGRDGQQQAAVVVEVKLGLSAGWLDAAQQTQRAADALGARYAALTNGQEWVWFERRNEDEWLVMDAAPEIASGPTSNRNAAAAVLWTVQDQLRGFGIHDLPQVLVGHLAGDPELGGLPIPADARQHITHMLASIDWSSVPIAHVLDIALQAPGQRERALTYTPRLIAEAISDLASALTLPGGSVLDLACGGGSILGFLADFTEGELILHGVDIDESAFALVQALMQAHGYRASFRRASALGPIAELPSGMDTVMIDPPFGLKIPSAELMGHFRLAKSPLSGEGIFLERAIALTRPGGHVVAILPAALLSAERHRYTRKFLLEEADVEAVIELPSGLWASSPALGGHILVAKRKGGAPPPPEVFMATASPGRREFEVKRAELNRAITDAVLFLTEQGD